MAETKQPSTATEWMGDRSAVTVVRMLRRQALRSAISTVFLGGLSLGLFLWLGPAVITILIGIPSLLFAITSAIRSVFSYINYRQFSRANRALTAVKVALVNNQAFDREARAIEATLVIEGSLELSNHDLGLVRQLIDNRPTITHVENAGKRISLDEWRSPFATTKLAGAAMLIIRAASPQNTQADQPKRVFSSSLAEDLSRKLEALQTIKITSIRAVSVAGVTKQGFQASQEDIALLNGLVQSGEIRYYELDGVKFPTKPRKPTPPNGVGFVATDLPELTSTSPQPALRLAN